MFQEKSHGKKRVILSKVKEKYSGPVVESWVLYRFLRSDRVLGQHFPVYHMF